MRELAKVVGKIKDRLRMDVENLWIELCALRVLSFLHHTLRNVYSFQRLHSAGHSRWYSRGVTTLRVWLVSCDAPKRRCLKFVQEDLMFQMEAINAMVQLFCITFGYFLLSLDSGRFGTLHSWSIFATIACRHFM